jgi:hypothetical protein
MKRAVSYAYVRLQGDRPSLMDQVMACRAHAEARGYSIVGEFNDIDASDHPNQHLGLKALQALIAEGPETVVLSYQPDPQIQDELAAGGVTLEAVPPLAARMAQT